MPSAPTSMLCTHSYTLMHSLLPPHIVLILIPNDRVGVGGSSSGGASVAGVLNFLGGYSAPLVSQGALYSHRLAEAYNHVFAVSVLILPLILLFFLLSILLCNTPSRCTASVYAVSAPATPFSE